MKVRVSHVFTVILPYHHLPNAGQQMVFDLCRLMVERLTGDICQRKLHGESFWIGGQTLPQGNLKQDHAVPDSSCAASLQQEFHIFSTAHRKGVGNFYKVPFKTHLLDANSKSTTTFSGLLAG